MGLCRGARKLLEGMRFFLSSILQDCVRMALGGSTSGRVNVFLITMPLGASHDAFWRNLQNPIRE